jgi:predicted amidohydrolase
VLATAADSETAIVAELELERLHDVRDRLPSLANRRPEVYVWPEETAIR